MADEEKWNTEDIDFDDEGRLVIKNEELSKAIDAEYAKKKYLVIRMVPFKEHEGEPIKDVVPPEDLASTSYGKALATELVQWAKADDAGTDGSDLPGASPKFFSIMERLPPPDPLQLGCGCDINVECP